MVVLVAQDGRSIGMARFGKAVVRLGVMIGALRVDSRFESRIELMIGRLGCSNLVIGSGFREIGTLTVLVGWLFRHGHRFGSLWIRIITNRKLSAESVPKKEIISKRTNY